ncbi:DUF5000 domain-containing lipoprotein [Candidatus Symbiothrix dinenymphae]|uniref:DUF5000 domain-containing lipoprotein n=1 Tax=Candidatus Symbiothrix dinenymphae TaxID=467085 RepID=UPI0006C11CCB|nr:DUF5000 domain-containing lipoprotein [Candidatus Symbiothrix dinenymphae]GAP72917.1 hypothetical protein SAMD00024442_5_34 [Candidatus Symbiothrix dinenymphae]
MKTIYFSVIACLFLLFSCEERLLEPTNKNLGKPESVAEATVSTTPIAGGVVIKYRVPDVQDILEVKAVYTTRTDGTEREASGSFYTNQLTLEGFNDTIEHTALLYVVNRALEKSDPVSVKFKPLESSLSKTAKTVKIVAGNGGADFSWKNEDRAALSFEFLTEDKAGTLQPATILSSYLDSSKYSLRGYLPEPRKFGLIISDNWGNASDVILPEGLITPLADNKLDKSNMKILILPSGPGDPKGDSPFYYWYAQNENLIDDDIYNFGHTANGTMPGGVSFTLDLGASASVSRLLLHQRNTDYLTTAGGSMYNVGNPKNFTVYGSSSNTVPSSDWSEWTPLADFEVIKPSGLPTYQVSDEDRRALIAGDEFSFPQGEPIRFLRFLFRDNWGNATFMHVAEITLYGGYVE